MGHQGQPPSVNQVFGPIIELSLMYHKNLKLHLLLMSVINYVNLLLFKLLIYHSKCCAVEIKK
jgi:hypothetical protein